MDIKQSRTQLYKQALQKLVSTTNLDNTSFISPLFDQKIIDSLTRLDQELANNVVNINPRNIKNVDYIKEILESYLVDDKIEIEEYLMDVQKMLMEKRTVLKGSVDEMIKENEQKIRKCNELKKEIERRMNHI